MADDSPLFMYEKSPYRPAWLADYFDMPEPPTITPEQYEVGDTVAISYGSESKTGVVTESTAERVTIRVDGPVWRRP